MEKRWYPAPYYSDEGLKRTDVNGNTLNLGCLEIKWKKNYCNNTFVIHNIFVQVML